MATDGDITVPNQVNGNTPDLHFSVDVAMASVSEGERSPPTIPREYKSVAVQAAVLSDIPPDFEDMDVRSMKKLLSSYRTVLQQLDALISGKIRDDLNNGQAPDARAVTNTTLVASHRVHFEMMTSLFAAQSHNGDLDITPNIFGNLGVLTAPDVCSAALSLNMCTFPNKVTVLVLKTLLIRPFHLYKEFENYRLMLCKTFSLWMRIIFGKSTFWTWIKVSFFHPDKLVTHIARSGSRLLCMRIRVQFTNIGNALNYGIASNDVITAHMNHILPLIHRWRSLHIFIDNGHSLSHMCLLLQPFTPPMLKHLTILLRSRYSPADGFLNPVAWFQPVLPSLEFLSVTSAGFAWHLGALFTLKHLELDMLSSSFYPSHADYTFIIGNCPQLDYLRLRWAGCSNFDYQTGVAEHRTIHSKSITTLVLAFDLNPSLGHLASLFQFDSLRIVHLELSSMRDMGIALLCTPLFGNEAFFHFPNPDPFTTVLWSLFKSAPTIFQSAMLQRPWIEYCRKLLFTPYPLSMNMLSIEESIGFRGLLRALSLGTTPTTQISQLLIWLDLSRSYALNVHILALSVRLYYPSDHDGFTLFQHFRHLIQLLSTRFSTCTKLVLEIDNIGLVRIAMEELKVANPAILTAMSVVMENEYHSFANFQPSCLANFVFPIAPAFGQPFLPISCLSIVGAGVCHPAFTHTASSTSMSIVQLPHQYSLAWLALIHLLSSSISLHHLILDAIQFLPSHPGTMIASPPMHICTLEVTFRGLQLMADVLAHIPFPYLTTLKVHFYNESNTQCLASCSSILNTVEELILAGKNPVEARVPDVFRFCIWVETLDMHAAGRRRIFRVFLAGIG
ncbi:hypothetical protein C8J57DRAFT_1533871 [Mycena rebaudengoi]|nr:hypothetical protein C8J57DRAFT_1533871 [Mycena rebaudengoi]